MGTTSGQTPGSAALLGQSGYACMLKALFHPAYRHLVVRELQVTHAPRVGQDELQHLVARALQTGTIRHGYRQWGNAKPRIVRVRLEHYDTLLVAAYRGEGACLDRRSLDRLSGGRPGSSWGR